jgi:exopolyphosphatase/guanosine-5'-triphosphate,3'-diphosphate pyrophosphatase
MLHTTQEPRAKSAQAGGRADGQAVEEKIYAALDLGTNNCRLLVATPAYALPDGTELSTPALRVYDSFSRIVRLGEGVSQTGALSEDAMDRTLQALKACQKKLSRYRLTDARFVATEACRRATNGAAFMQRVLAETGLAIDIISTEEEARLAFMGCASLLTDDSSHAIVFDIGGGSTELMWIDVKNNKRIADWLSVGFGVMNLADKFGGSNFSDMAYDDMVHLLAERIRPFDNKNNIGEMIEGGKVQLLSTSGTVTTLAAIHLDLPRYDRSRIDGLKLPVSDIRNTTSRLLKMRPSERFNHPCIGSDRSDFIISGCAIFDAISSLWPTAEITIADRGVREGIILSLINRK